MVSLSKVTLFQVNQPGECWTAWSWDIPLMVYWWLIMIDCGWKHMMKTNKKWWPLHHLKTDACWWDIQDERNQSHIIIPFATAILSSTEKWLVDYSCGSHIEELDYNMCQVQHLLWHNPSWSMKNCWFFPTTVSRTNMITCSHRSSSRFCCPNFRGFQRKPHVLQTGGSKATGTVGMTINIQANQTITRTESQRKIPAHKNHKNLCIAGIKMLNVLMAGYLYSRTFLVSLLPLPTIINHYYWRSMHIQLYNYQRLKESAAYFIDCCIILTQIHSMKRFNGETVLNLHVNHVSTGSFDLLKKMSDQT